MTDCSEFFFSVDVETAGPSPGEYALLSIGACTLDTPPATFYLELRPTRTKISAEALAVHGLDPHELATQGVPPEEAMQRFAEWVESHTPPGMRAVFVGFNAPFDWMFVADYFWRYLGRNPFGHSALDIKSLYLGMKGGCWSDTTYERVVTGMSGTDSLVHNALQDAIDQGQLFRLIYSLIQPNR
jgi:ribonuclease T